MHLRATAGSPPDSHNGVERPARRGDSKLLVALAILAVVFATLATTALQTSSAAGIAVQSSTATSSFPNGISFRVAATSDAPISQARLHFQLLPTGPITAMSADCNGDTQTTCSRTIGGSFGLYIVPFTQVRYWWELTDSSGAKQTTPERTVSYDDTRFKWKSLSDGNLTVHYYDADEGDIRDILRTGRETIDRMSRVMGTTIDFPVKILDYATVRDLQPAVASSRFGGNGVTLGEVSSADTALATRESFGGSDGLDTIRHEVAHIVTDHATRANPHFEIWLNEGISVWAQKEVDSVFQRSVERAVRTNTAVPLTGLTVSLRTSNPNLFYGQSYSVVKYLIDTYGEDRFTSFIRSVNAGLTNEALRKTFGLEGIDALEDAWRKGVGLPDRPAAGAGTSDTGANANSVLPTIVPFGAPAVPSTDTSAGNSSDTPTNAATGDSTDAFPTAAVVIGVTLAAVLLSGGLFVRSRRAAGSSRDRL